jgi:hypothetical protein
VLEEVGRLKKEVKNPKLLEAVEKMLAAPSETSESRINP